MPDTENIRHTQPWRCRPELDGSLNLASPDHPRLDDLTEDQRALTAVFHWAHQTCDYLLYLLESGWVELHCPTCDSFRCYPPSIDAEKGGE